MGSNILLAKAGLTLVTGASGFVGAAVVARLLSESVQVRACIRRQGAATPMGAERVLIGDLDGETDWSKALDGVQFVMHAAARVHIMKDSASEPLLDFRRVNVQGTLNLAEQSAVRGVRRFVYISSAKVNGESTSREHPFTEQDEPAPGDAYGLSKAEAEAGLRQIAARTGMDVVIVRPPLIYGPGVKANFAALVRVAVSGWPLPFGAIDNRRSLIALDNFVDFAVTCLAEARAANQTFLISDGQDLSTAELVRGLALAAGRPVRLVKVPVWILKVVGMTIGRAGAIQRLTGSLQLDISKARNSLEWKPPLTVSEGLQRVLAKVD